MGITKQRGVQPLDGPDVNQITDNLWVGGELDRKDHDRAVLQMKAIEALGIDAIVDCRLDRDDSLWATETHPQIDFLSIGVEDAGHRMPDGWFDDGTEYSIDQIEAGHVVLVHCQAGINRGPSMAFAIMLANGSDTVEALDAVHRARPDARIAYAEDAARWWFSKTDSSLPPEGQVDRVRRWRESHGWPSRTQYQAWETVITND
jgi:dual specificity phosphatase 3